MKAKGKFSGESLGKFFKLHGEKVGLAVVGVGALLFVMSAVTQGTMPEDQHPDKLKAKAETAQRHVEAKRIDDEKERKEHLKTIKTQWPLPVFDTEKRNLEAAKYALLPVRPPIIDPKVKRTEPTYFPAESLELSAGRGAFAVKGAAKAGGASGGPVAVGKYYVVVKALVPTKKQLDEYHGRFANAERPPGWSLANDRPQYLLFNLQRAEAVPGVADDQLNWTTIDYNAVWTAVNAMADEFQGNAREIVSEQYIEPKLVHVTDKLKDLLPPRLLADWTLDEVCHSQIADANRKTKAATETPMPEKPADGKKPLDGALDGAGDKKAESDDKPKPAADNDDKTAAEDTVPVHRLLRYFDFGVQPGQSYRYRVQLVLRNPNKNPALADRFLADVKLREGDIRLSPWSASSAAIRVPTDIEVFAGRVSPVDVRKKVFEPEAESLPVRWLPAEAVEAYKALAKLRRGSWLNDIRDPYARDPLTGEIKVLTGKTLSTDGLIVDLRGGEAIGKPGPDALTEPGEILLMDASGQLVIRSESLDEKQVAARKPAEPMGDGPVGGEKGPDKVGPDKGPDARPSKGIFDIPDKTDDAKDKKDKKKTREEKK